MPDFYQLESGIGRIKLGEGKSRWQKVLSIFAFFLTVKTDVVISYTQRANLLCLIPLVFRRKIIVLAGERNISGSKQTRRERFLFNVLYGRANYIVPNSFSQADYISEKKPSLSGKIVPINNYTDIESFKPSPLPLGGVVKIAVFARFQRQKNCVRFARMIGRLKKESDRPFVVDWFGRRNFDSPSHKEYYDSFISLVNELGIEDVLRINDPVKDVSGKIAEYDIVCMPSVLVGFSNSIAEGISSGRPMLVSDISDNGRMVHDGENGFLFDPYKVDSMLGALQKMLGLPDDSLIQMGLRSREIAEELFDKERFVLEYMTLIDSKK